MFRPSRRALLNLLGFGTTVLLAGCQTGPPTEQPSESATQSPSSTSTSSTTASETETATESPTELLDAADCAAVSRPEAAWPVPQRSPARDGYVADPDEFKAAPAPAWEAKPSAPDDSSASPEYGQPVVADDDVYLTNHLDRGPMRPMYGHVHALDTESGDRRWASERFRSPSHPVVWEDTVVLVAENEDRKAIVVACDRSDGTRRWTHTFAPRTTGFVTAGDHLYLTLGRATSRGTVYALDSDGETVWSREGAFVDPVTAGPTVGPDLVYVATQNGKLHALNRDDGTLVWSHRLEHPTDQRPYVTHLVAIDCAIFAVFEGMVTALDDDDGTPVWDVEGGTLATDGEAVYVTTGIGSTREVSALEAATGEVRWRAGGPVETYGPTVVAGDAVYVRSDDSVVALDRAAGAERWRTDGSLENLALADGTLYGTDQGTLLALR
jgi:outer membrane protein assembly factor BamB